MHQEKENFLNYLKTIKNYSSHTIRNYEITLREYLQYSRSQMTPYCIRKFLAHLHVCQKKSRTIMRSIAALRSFSKYLFHKKIIKENPLLNIITPKQSQKIPSFLDFNQIIRLFAQPNTSIYLGTRDRCIMEVIYSSGLRVSELCALNKEDVNIKNLYIKLKGKGKKNRHIPLTEEAAFWITSYLYHKERKEIDIDALFLNHKGKRLSTRSVDRFFVSYKRKASIENNLTPHTLRHTIATHLLENGVNIKVIQKFLGHSNLSTTTIYTHVSLRLKEKVYKQSHPLEKKNS